MTPSMMYFTLFKSVSSTVPSSRTNSVVTPPNAIPVLAIWFKNRCTVPSSKLINRLEIESINRRPPCFSWMLCPISLLASEMIPAS